MLQNIRKSGGRIVQAASCECQSAILYVRYNGIGIEAEQLRDIFQLFMQVDQGTPPPLSQPLENRPSQVENTVSTCQVLVVDDNRDAANSLALLLRTLGHDAQVANSGEEAIALVERHSPKVVFLDIGMPGMDGFEVARRLRADPAKADLCLAALTGWGQAEDRRKTAEAGFNHHIVKPPEMQRILQVLSHATTKP